MLNVLGCVLALSRSLGVELVAGEAVVLQAERNDVAEVRCVEIRQIEHADGVRLLQRHPRGLAVVRHCDVLRFEILSYAGRERVGVAGPGP